MGGSCASLIIPTINSIDQISIATHNKCHSSKSSHILPNCIVIWLFHDPSKLFQNQKEQIRRLVYGFQVFTNADICINYIRDNQDEKIFLITSLTYQSIVTFYHLPQVEKIYIFDSSSSEDNKHSLQYNIFHHIDHLCQQLQQDIDLCEFDLISFSTMSNVSDDIEPSMNLTREQASFIFIQITNEILDRLKFDSNAKNAFIEFCRMHYANNDEELRIIDEFAKYYRPNTAFDWLKRICFISKILNRAKRTRKIDIIYKLRFFLKHLHMQLIHLHEENALLLNNISIVYRGKTISNNEYDLLIKNNCHGLSAFSNLIGTTVNKEKSLQFIHRRLTTHPDMNGILFEIYLDHTIFNEDSPYALLKGNDAKNSEIYFDVSTVFGIKSIEQIQEYSLIIWCVKLQLISNDDPQLLCILTPFRTAEQHENPLACLGKLLMEMKEYRRVEQFFLELLNDTSILSQPRRLVRARNGLGANYAHQGDYATALIHYEQARKVSLTYLPSDHSDLALAYKNIGDCYLHQNDYSYTLEHYERAIHLIENNLHSAKPSMINELQTLVYKIKNLIENNKSLS